MVTRNAKVNNHANTWVFALEVSTGIKIANTECWRMSDASGVLNLNMPQQLLPFLEVGDVVLVNIAVIKSIIEQISPIIRPDNAEIN